MSDSPGFPVPEVLFSVGFLYPLLLVVIFLATTLIIFKWLFWSALQGMLLSSVSSSYVSKFQKVAFVSGGA